MRKISFLFMIAIFEVTILSSCSGINIKSNSSGSSSKKISTVTSATDSKPDTISQNTVLEKSYDSIFNKQSVKTFTAEFSDGTLWLPVSISDDMIYGFTAPVNNKPSKIVTYDLNTKKLSMVYSIRDNYQPEFLQYNNDYIVWTEYVAAEDGGGQRVELFNRNTKKAQILDASKQSKSGDIQIAIGNDYVLWSYATLDENNKLNYKIYSYNFKTSKTTVFKDMAYMPVIGNNFIAWIGPLQENYDFNSLYYQDLTNNTITTMFKGYSPKYLAANGDNLVFSGSTITSSPKNLGMENVLILYNNGKQTMIEKSKTHYYEFPNVSNNYIGWDENQKKRVYSIKLNTIIDFPSDYGEAFVSDKYIMWGTDAIPNESKEQAQKDGMYKTIVHIIKAD